MENVVSWVCLPFNVNLIPWRSGIDSCDDKTYQDATEAKMWRFKRLSAVGKKNIPNSVADAHVERESLKKEIIHQLHSREWRARHVEITEKKSQPWVKCGKYTEKLRLRTDGKSMILLVVVEYLGTELPFGSVHDVVATSSFDKASSTRLIVCVPSTEAK
jgi:hypothetical protein